MNRLNRRIGMGCAIAACLCFVAWGQAPPRSAILDSAQLLDDLRTLSSDAMQGRRTGSPGAQKARALIVERFRQSGVLPFGASYEQRFVFTGGEGVNVVGRIDGKLEPRRYIVISAHYDHLGVRNGQVFNGADDNASGTAALFAIAKYFSTHQPQNSLIFAAFDDEEGGRRGSQTFVRQPPVGARQLSLNLNADMIGREPDNRLFVVGGARQPYLKPYISALAAKSPVKVLMGHEDPRQPEDWTEDSDHYTFMQAGIPALYFGVEDFDQHHQPTDDFETITQSFYLKAVETLIQAVQVFDEGLGDIEKARAAASPQRSR